MNDGRVWNWTVIILLGWGVFTLGASRPWGYGPLLAGMGAYGAATLVSREESGRIGHGLYFSLVILCVAVFLQLIPLPAPLLSMITPALTIAVHGGSAAARPLSVDPSATGLALTFLVALCLFFIGVVNTMGHGGARRLATGLVVLGTLVALVGIAEASTPWVGIYRTAGLPLPPDSTPHGPFSSKNHYAGWMLMTLAVTMGYLCAVAEQSRSALTSRMLVIQSAAMVMAVALVQTKSRAGILGLTLTIATMGGLVMRRSSAVRTRILVASLLIALMVAGVVVTGVQPILGRFGTASWSTAHGRLPIWRQVTAIARDFPITGSGLNTYQRIVSAYPTAELDEPYEGAHNDYLQLAAEGGLLVGLPALATLAFFTRETRRRFRERSSDGMTRWIRVGAVVGLSIMAMQETVDFSLQVPGNAALFVVLSAIALHRAPKPKGAPLVAN